MRVIQTQREAFAYRLAAAQDDWDAYPSEDHIGQDDLNDVLDGVRTLADFNRRGNRGAAQFYAMPPDQQLDHFNDHIVPIYQEYGLPVRGRGRWMDFTDAVKDRWR